MATSAKHNSSTARDNILKKLKAQVAGADYSKLPKEQTYQYPKMEQQEKQDLFIQLLEANHAQVIQVSNDKIVDTVQAELNKRNIKTLLYGKNTAFSDALETQLSEINCQAYNFLLTENKPLLFEQIPAAITSSLCGIAATGSIVRWPTADEPRSMSLVPPVHFVVVDAQKLYQNFAELIQQQQWQNKMPTNVLLISGPSKTADIQQTLAYGAHGPKELIVLLING